ncbi:MAG TPA: PhoD-like phosphatase N-terminal domain-containing protein [Acidimicrobiales bacterium]|nr:PhoD-like phosphatase N-terminal domain-containing protein [Acidimicrobiales bacterium]
MRRRTTLKGMTAVVGGALFGGTVEDPAHGAGIDTAPPAGWDYPAAVALLPFGHGVASGDPLADRVILWTRITVPDASGWRAAAPQGVKTVDVGWVTATDPALDNVVVSGRVVTTRALDWTVKVEASGLSSRTTYYYAFSALGFRSPIGRTRTAPALGDRIDELRFAHISCTSWWSTDFHFYRRIAGATTSTCCCTRVITDDHDLDDDVVEGKTLSSRAQSAEVMWAWTPIARRRHRSARSLAPRASQVIGAVKWRPFRRLCQPQPPRYGAKVGG